MCADGAVKNAIDEKQFSILDTCKAKQSNTVNRTKSKVITAFQICKIE
jgi:hypothetical protein